MAEVQRKGNDTRQRLLDLAEQSVLEKGFGATSIEELIAGVGITKSGFFYHFKDKGDLAKALMQRYVAYNNKVLADIFARADQLNDEPLHGFLVAMKLFAEMLAELPDTHPGCLVASFVYQEQLFKREVKDLTAAGVLGWRTLFRERLERIAEKHPPRIAVDLDDLADMANALIDGGIILSKVLKDKTMLPRQIMLYREFVHAVFAAR